MSGGPGVMWFRRDLRLDDNPAWSAATSAHDEVVAAFVLEPALLGSVSEPRRDQLLANLTALDRELRDRGGALVVRDGPAVQAIPAIVDECDAASVHLNADWSPFARRRDRDVEDALEIEVERHQGNVVHPPGTVLTKDGELSKVFSAFHRTWSSIEREPWPEPGSATPLRLPSDELPAAGTPPCAPGSSAAWARLRIWLDHVDGYDDSRNMIAEDGTSELSTDLRFGTLAARTVVDVVGTDTPGRAAFVRQLAWRDWYAHTLEQHPDLATRPLRDEYDRIDWCDDADGFAAWAEGRTGFPIVDAGMRQLTSTGRMHNRVRMLCASFLVKDLLIDWRRGERFFRRHLLDGDLAQNAGNWQWVAGTGPDAAPYFRVFNPTTQSRKFDPDGTYIRRWVPELAALDGSSIHEPSGVDAEELAAAGIELGSDYPAPIVDHATARERALDAYSVTKGD
jgi:deoxyribodipyrimidine photo-lyase